MATPDFTHESSEIDWSIQPNYGPQDNYGQRTCAMSGFDRRGDEVVYRGPWIDDFHGYFTISQMMAEQLARLVGYIDPDDLVMTPDEELLIENEGLKEQVLELEERLAGVLAAVAS